MIICGTRQIIKVINYFIMFCCSSAHYLEFFTHLCLSIIDIFLRQPGSQLHWKDQICKLDNVLQQLLEQQIAAFLNEEWQQYLLLV